MIWKKETFSFAAAVLLAASAVCLIQDIRQTEPFAEGEAYSGMLAFSEPKTDGGTMRGFAETADGRRVYATYAFKSEEEMERYAAVLAHSFVLAEGKFEAAGPPAHKYAFDMGAYLKHNGTQHVLKLSRISSAAPRQGLPAWLSARRQALLAHIRSVFPESLSAEAEALLAGERSRMTDEEQALYQKLGITHLYAISGLHIGILTGLLYFLLIRLRLRKETVRLLLLLVLPLYAGLTGGAPSVVRAVSMACLVLAAGLFRLKAPPAAVLLLTYIGFVLLDPYAIYQIGFQLSYGAAFGLILSMRLLRDVTFWKAGLLITCISQLTLAPLLLFHFCELSISAFAVNSVYVPLYSFLIVPANFLLLLLSAASPALADAVFLVYEPLRQTLRSLTEWLGGIPYQLWTPGRPSAGWTAVLIASVLLFFSRAEKRFRCRQLMILLIPAALLTLLPYADASLRITFIDVGQGDSTLIELPHRQGVYLIDAGGVLRFGQEEYRKKAGPYEVGRQIVVPLLKGKGITEIDALILTHPDADHIEGAEEVAEQVDVHALHVTPGSLEEAGMSALAPLLPEMQVAEPGRGTAWSAGGVRFSYLSPSDGEYAGNNDSLVLLMENGPLRILFTGDLEEAGETAILKENGRRLEGLTVLKVGHHGSKTSSSEPFLEALSPALSVISAGRDNRYGHPAPEVTERFRQLGLPVLVTAENGTVEISYEKGRLFVRKDR